MNELPKRESTETTPPFIKNQEAFSALFPGVIQDGTIDLHRLEEALGVNIEGLKDAKDRFGLMWAGKKKALEALQQGSRATLKPDFVNSVGWDEANHVFIEGDNLEVLKVIQSAYNDQIKLIYLDPPYNTGKDFIYTDDFSDPLRRHLEVTGQLDPEGNRLTANPETAGRKHSNWLNMMYPRLVLARNLLSADGILAISIDDNEVHNLRIILDSIFGPENFEGHIHWRRRHNQPNDPNKMIALVAEHILVYARDKQAFKNSGVGKLPLTGDFTNPDADPRGPWASKPWKVGTGQNGSKYAILKPNGEYVDGEWMGDEANFKALLEDSRIFFPNNGSGSPRKKYFKSEREQEGQSATNWWSHDQFGHNQGASKELEELFGHKGIFDNPKPTDLLRGLIQIANVKSGQIVADFFAGSGSLAHAVMLQNEEDGQVRRSISVTLPELIDEKEPAFEIGYRLISEICRKRISLALEKNALFNRGIRCFSLGESAFENHQFDAKDALQLFSESIQGVFDPKSTILEILIYMGKQADTPIRFEQIEGGYIGWSDDTAVISTLIVDENLIDRIFKAKVSSIVYLEDAFSGKDALKSNTYFAAKQLGIMMRTF